MELMLQLCIAVLVGALPGMVALGVYQIERRRTLRARQRRAERLFARWDWIIEQMEGGA